MAVSILIRFVSAPGDTDAVQILDHDHDCLGVWVLIQQVGSASGPLNP